MIMNKITAETGAHTDQLNEPEKPLETPSMSELIKEYPVAVQVLNSGVAIIKSGDIQIQFKFGDPPTSRELSDKTRLIVQSLIDIDGNPKGEGKRISVTIEHSPEGYDRGIPIDYSRVVQKKIYIDTTEPTDEFQPY